MRKWGADAIDAWKQLDDQLLQLESLLTRLGKSSLMSAETAQFVELVNCHGMAREARVLAEELFRHTSLPAPC